jgi:hypothetical protein
LKHFIELPNQYKAVILEKSLVKQILNSPSADEMNIVDEKDPEEEKKEVNVYVMIDESFAREVEDKDIEKVGSEDDSILSNDCEQEKFREYSKNLVISILQNLGLKPGKKLNWFLSQQTRSLRMKSLAVNRSLG